MNSFKPVIISAIIAIISMHLMICSAIDTSNSHQENVVEVNVTLPEVKLKNDILMQIIKYDIYPLFDELVSDKTIYLRSTFEGPPSDLSFYLRAITPLEHACFKIEKTNTGYTTPDLIGFIKYKYIYIFLDKSYYPEVEEVISPAMHFSLKTIYYKGSPIQYDPWDRVYYIKNDTVRRLGTEALNTDPANREYMKKILNAME